MWHDNETDKDLIGFQRFIDIIAGLAMDPEILPVTIGIFGDWGSGKSSALRMIEAKLKQQENVLILRFDGWLFEGYDDTKAALMSSIIDAIEQYTKSNQTTWEKIKDKAESLRKRINWFRTIGLATKGVLTLTSPAGAALVGGLTIAKILEFVGKKAEDPEAIKEAVKKYINDAPSNIDEISKNIRDFREEFCSYIEEANIATVVILIDDLDRCLPESIVATLEAIKLFLAVPKTAFVIAADERIVKHAIGRRYPTEQYREFDLSQEYLDKMVQIPYVLPPMDETETESYMYLLFAKQLLKQEQFDKLYLAVQQNRMNPKLAQPLNYGIAQSCLGTDANALEAVFALIERTASILARHLGGNPRLVKRFLNAFSLRLRLAGAVGITLDETVLAKLMILERFHGDQFSQLYQWQAKQHGSPKELAELEAWVEKKDAESEGESNSPLSIWKTDADLVSWLQMEPHLKEVNFSPYFYLARESIKVKMDGGRRLSQDQQELLLKLKSGAESARKHAAKALSAKPESEIYAVVDALSNSIRLNPTDTDALSGLLEIAYLREGITAKTIDVFKALSPGGINIKLIPAYGELHKKYPSIRQNVIDQLNDWKNSNTTGVSKAAHAVLQRISSN